MAAGGGTGDAAFIAGTSRARRPRRARDGLRRHPRAAQLCRRNVGQRHALVVALLPPWAFPILGRKDRLFGVHLAPPGRADIFGPHRADEGGRATLCRRLSGWPRSIRRSTAVAHLPASLRRRKVSLAYDGFVVLGRAICRKEAGDRGHSCALLLQWCALVRN